MTFAPRIDSKGGFSKLPRAGASETRTAHVTKLGCHIHDSVAGFRLNLWILAQGTANRHNTNSALTGDISYRN